MTAGRIHMSAFPSAHTGLFTSLRRAATWLVPLWLGAGVVSPGIAGPGTLDAGFGAGGIVVTDFNGSIDDAALAVAVQGHRQGVGARVVFFFARKYHFSLLGDL